MTCLWKYRFALLPALFMMTANALCTEPSPFESRELSVTPSPNSTAELRLPADSTVVDYDIWPTGPDVLILLRDSAGTHAVSWHAGESATVALLDLPAGFNASAIAVHPMEQRFFVLGKSGQQSKILVAKKLNGVWTQHAVYQSAHDLRRLLVAPRPFQWYEEARKGFVGGYRLLFAERQPNSVYATRSITEEGKREYQVIGPESSYPKPDIDTGPPTHNFVSSALPAAFHPGGHILIWQDDKGCFQQLGYAEQNWGQPSSIAGNPCGGSLTVTPNGAALLHWKRGAPGIAVMSNRGQATAMQASEYQFITVPSSTPDGKGIVGLVEQDGGKVLVYVPIDVPLADVINAWMFTENSADQQKFSTDAGLFRLTGQDQMYELYDTEAYACGGYSSLTPTRPYFVTTDIFWELIASAYEGTFIVQERQQAMPAFWDFVAAAQQSLKASAPNSSWAMAMNAVLQSRSTTSAATAEAQHIQRAEGTFNSRVFGGSFNFTELTPRGHYTSTPEMSAYFKAVHYLTSLAAESGAAPLNSLPDNVKAKALRWIAAYSAFIAPSRAPLAWKSEGFAPPGYTRHPLDKQQIFPLSWGFDNEVLLSTIYHSDWPEAEQIKGANGQRLLPSGVDLAAALSNGYARSLLKTDLAQYPALGPALDALQQRQPKSVAHSNLYDAWIDALAVQWADDATFPGIPTETLWKAKRLQTGLASWATLRHATVLVNERVAAECGEGGFEEIVLRPPRGYVEPDPKTFNAIASLFNQIGDAIAHSANFKGNLPLGEDVNDKTEPLRSGIIRRLLASASKARLFASLAEKELRNEPLSNAEYDEILHVGAVAEHDFLVYKSLANKDLALSIPDPMMKIADVAGGEGTSYLEAAVGRPLEWDQVVPYFGRREIVKGSVYSYYEFPSPAPLTDLTWGGKSDDANASVDPSKKATPVAGMVDNQDRPAWVKEFVSAEKLSCPAKAPF